MRLLFNYIQHRFRIRRPAIGGLLIDLFISFTFVDYLGLSLPIMNTALQGDHIPFLLEIFSRWDYIRIGFLWWNGYVAVCHWCIIWKSLC